MKRKDDNSSAEELVQNFLKKNKNFFIKHPELLKELQFPLKDEGSDKVIDLQVYRYKKSPGTFTIMHTKIIVVDRTKKTRKAYLGSANFTKAGDYSFCDIDCKHNEHALIDNDCEICNKQVRQTFSVSTNKSLILDTNNFIVQSICIIIPDNSFGPFLSRAPPSNIS